MPLRVGLYCPACLPGYHMPFLGAARSGLFAEHGLDIEFSEPRPGPENIRSVAHGELDFCITSVAHFLHACDGRPIGARFVAMFVQQSPIAGLVAEDSDLQHASHLPGHPLGGPDGSGLVVEYQEALAARGLESSVLVDMDYAVAPAALGRGEVEIVPDFCDLVPRTRRQAGIRVRAIPIGGEIYSSGLVAADRIPLDVVTALRSAMCTGLQRQRADPQWGLGALCERYPTAIAEDALEGWAIVAPRIFSGAPVGRMEAGRWSDTIRRLSRAHALGAPLPEGVYRPECLAVTDSRQSAPAMAAIDT
jgi:NMT1/THI5 like